MAIGTNGYLTKCRQCSEQIYVKLDFDDKWRPYKSWVDEQVDEGVWELHECSERAAVRHSIPVPAPRNVAPTNPPPVPTFDDDIPF
jgi:hypothetical protein